MMSTRRIRGSKLINPSERVMDNPMFFLVNTHYNIVDWFIKSLCSYFKTQQHILQLIVEVSIGCPGAPQALLQNCLTFGAFSFVIEGLNQRQSALAMPFLESTRQQHHVYGALPPLAIPLANELKESFSSFCQSIGKRDNTHGKAKALQ